MFASIGWAYDLKTVASGAIQKRAARTGDGSKYGCSAEDHNGPQHVHDDGAIWGWGDADMPIEDMKDAEIINKGD